MTEQTTKTKFRSQQDLQADLDLTREELENALDKIVVLQTEASSLREEASRLTGELAEERARSVELRSHLLFAEHELNRYLIAERDTERDTEI